VAFICHPIDARDLKQRIDTSVFREREYVIVTNAADLQEQCTKAGLVVCFVSKSEDHSVMMKQ